MRRNLQTFACGATLAALVTLASLCLSYSRFVHSVELAAGSAGVIDR